MDNPKFWIWSNITICLGLCVALVASLPHFVALGVMTLLMVGSAVMTTNNRKPPTKES